MGLDNSMLKFAVVLALIYCLHPPTSVVEGLVSKTDMCCPRPGGKCSGQCNRFCCNCEGRCEQASFQDQGLPLKGKDDALAYIGNGDTRKWLKQLS